MVLPEAIGPEVQSLSPASFHPMSISVFTHIQPMDRRNFGAGFSNTQIIKGLKV
jgi:hypothetical protein